MAYVKLPKTGYAELKNAASTRSRKRIITPERLSLKILKYNLFIVPMTTVSPETAEYGV
ncbi:MAG: hypothetical protein ACOC6N_00235 [archaeon]